MKKIILLGILVVSGLSFGRDYEYREKSELQPVESTGYEEQEMLTRERELDSQVIYSNFHRDLDNMSRGHESR